MDEKQKTVTAVSTTDHVGAPQLNTRRSALSVTGSHGFSIVSVTVAEHDIDAVRAELEADAGQWTEFRVHDYQAVADLWVRERLDEHRGTVKYRIGEQVTSWHGTELRGAATMTRRDDLKPGDQFHSSHWGRVTVDAIVSRGLTTTIRGTRKHEIEAYDRNLLVPKYN